jgi:hypothetical protein
MEFHDKQWNKQYEKLAEFKQTNGHCIVPRTYPEDTSLGMWVNTQRQFHSKNAIRLDRKELLDDIGFVWKARVANTDKSWHQQYKRLVEFKQTNGHCIVPRTYQEDISLGMWVNTQRQFHSKNAIRLDRKVLLDEIGFVWKARVANTDKSWHQQYDKLVEFKQTNGHCLVPQGYTKDVSLGMWINTQRQFHSNNIMRLDRKVLLDEIGFAWKVRAAGNYKGNTDKTWHPQYEKLVEFKQTNGHCLVPQGYAKDVSLGKWVNTQRGRHANNIMRLDRKELLDEIGFAWKGRAAGNYKGNTDKTWYRQYEKLVEFKQTNGHCLVPQGYEKDVSLGMWVSAQRTYHTNNNIRPDRKVLLDEQGFVWKGDLESTWKKQYEKLAEFKRKKGHCLVPQKYQEDVSLVKWVNVQRRRHVNNKMRLDRKGLLDEIGFVWKADTLAARASTTDVSCS